MKHPHIITSNSVVAFIEGKRYSCPCDSIKYKQVLSAISKGDDQAFAEAMKASEVQHLRTASQDAGFEVVNGVVCLDGIEIIGSLQDKLSRMIRESYNMQHFAAFVRNLRQNPSQTSIKELYDFLGYSELPISEDGFLFAYKGVQKNYLSVRSGLLKPEGAKVINGHIDNSVGNKIFVDRGLVDDDRSKECSVGLHVGSHNYATGWGEITVIVKINPAHVVSVPKDCECQKMRVHAYEVVADYSDEIKSAVVTSQGQGITTERKALAKQIEEKVVSLRKRGGAITVKRIQSCLSPKCEPLHVIRDILIRELGYQVAVDPDNKTSVGAMFI